MRLDRCPETDGRTYIVRDDLDTSFTIGGRSYVRGGYPGPYEPWRETFKVVESAAVAIEDVRGATSRKFRARFRLTHGQTGEGYYWARQGIMIRVDLRYTKSDGSVQSMLMELDDLVIGAQDPAQFQVPDELRDITDNI